LIVNKNIKSPWRILLEFEKYDRGEWLLQAKQTFPDICPELRNKLSTAYFYTKHVPTCPIAAGVSFDNFLKFFKKIK
jgi:hypothetical protein